MTNTRPIHEHAEGITRLKPVKNGVTLMYGVDSLQQCDRYECPECGDTMLLGFGQKRRPTAETREERIEKAVEEADVIPERVKESLSEMEVDF